jgi:hypothetical protein
MLHFGACPALQLLSALTLAPSLSVTPSGVLRLVFGRLTFSESWRLRSAITRAQSPVATIREEQSPTFSESRPPVLLHFPQLPIFALTIVPSLSVTLRQLPRFGVDSGPQPRSLVRRAESTSQCRRNAQTPGAITLVYAISLIRQQRTNAPRPPQPREDSFRPLLSTALGLRREWDHRPPCNPAG